MFQINKGYIKRFCRRFFRQFFFCSNLSHLGRRQELSRGQCCDRIYWPIVCIQIGYFLENQCYVIICFFLSPCQNESDVVVILLSLYCSNLRNPSIVVISHFFQGVHRSRPKFAAAAGIDFTNLHFGR
jgi:hypothetical protein